MLMSFSSIYIQILTSTTDSKKETHKYVFGLVKASRIMPVDRVEKQTHIKDKRKKHLKKFCN